MITPEIMAVILLWCGDPYAQKTATGAIQGLQCREEKITCVRRFTSTPIAFDSLVDKCFRTKVTIEMKPQSP